MTTTACPRGHPDGASACASVDPAPAGWRVELGHRCSVSPRQHLLHSLALGGVHAATAIGFAMAGYPIVSLFCAVQFAGIVAVFGCFARRAGDVDVVTVDGPRLIVDQWRAGRHRRIEMDACRTRLVAGPAANAPASLSALGLRVPLRAKRDDPRTQALARQLQRSRDAALAPFR